MSLGPTIRSALNFVRKYMLIFCFIEIVLHIAGFLDLLKFTHINNWVSYFLFFKYLRENKVNFQHKNIVICICLFLMQDATENYDIEPQYGNLQKLLQIHPFFVPTSLVVVSFNHVISFEH